HLRHLHPFPTRRSSDLIDKLYVSRDPDNHHYWFPPTTNVAVYFNLQHPVPGNVAIRQAMAAAIDRERVSKIGESGYQPAANQTGDRKSTRLNSSHDQIS